MILRSVLLHFDGVRSCATLKSTCLYSFSCAVCLLHTKNATPQKMNLPKRREDWDAICKAIFANTQETVKSKKSNSTKNSKLKAF